MGGKIGRGASALYEAISKNISFCIKNGIPIIKWTWHQMGFARGLPSVMVAKQAEVSSASNLLAIQSDFILRSVVV